MRMEVVDEVAWSICHMFVSVRLSYMVVFLFLYLRTLCTFNAHSFHTFCICALLSTLFAHSLNTICTHHAVQLLLHILCTRFGIIIVNSLQPYCTLNANCLNILWTLFCTLIAHSLHSPQSTLFMHSLHTFVYNFTHVVHYFYILCVPFQHFCKYFAPYQLRCILKGHLNCIEKKTLHFLKSEIHFFAFFRIFIFAVFLGQISRNMLSLLIWHWGTYHNIRSQSHQLFLSKSFLM